WREDYNHQHQTIVMPPAGSSDPILGDLIRFDDFNYMAQVARLNAAVLATLAAAPGEPRNVSIVNTKLENGTTLHWEAPLAEPGARYQLVWRETTAPEWQRVKEVDAVPAGTPVSITVPISKDNVIFGVRAVDAAGHRGLVVVP
ncbi:MAG: M28 family metallopeptidase, partial [Terracidiphilus sp.]